MPARGAKPPNPVSVGFIVTLFVIEGFSEVSQDERNWIGMFLVWFVRWNGRRWPRLYAPVAYWMIWLGGSNHDREVGWIQSRS